MRIRTLGLTLLLLAISGLPASAREITVKAGGGVSFDPNRWGGHVSFEIPLSEEYPTNLAPFLEYYTKDGTKMIPTGVSLMYKARISDAGGTIYFGVGGGALMIRGEPGGGQVKGTEGMITAALGLSFGIGERFGFFVQSRWFRPFADETKDNLYGAQFGLSFDLGGE